MNIALSTVIIFLCLIPGIIIRTTIRRGPYRHRGDESPLNEPPYSVGFLQKGAFYVVASGVSLYCWYFLFGYITGLSVPTNSILVFACKDVIINGQVKDVATLDLISHQRELVEYFVKFYLSLYVASWLLGWLIRWFIDEFMIDIHVSLFRQNNWYYLLNGDLARTKQFRKRRTRENFPRLRKRDHVIVSLSTVVCHDKLIYLYMGLVYSVSLDEKGNLDKVILSEAWRRKLTKDRIADEQRINPDEDGRFYRIEGNALVLRANEMRTINIEYIAMVSEGKPWYEKLIRFVGESYGLIREETLG